MSEALSWEEFRSKLVNRLGSSKRILTLFVEHTDYNSAIVQRWRKQDSVPREAFNAIEDIDPQICRFENFTGFHSIKFTKRVIGLSNEGRTLRDIAQILSGEFGRPITDSMVKGIRYRNKEHISHYPTRRAKQN